MRHILLVFSIGETDQITLANIRKNEDSTANISGMKIDQFAREIHKQVGILGGNKQNLVRKKAYWKGVCLSNFR